MVTPGVLAQMACVFEATARKAGNVHRYRDFPGLTYLDFIMSAAAIVPALDQAPNQRLGQTILKAIQATREAVRTNTNLGIVLLLAPLAAVDEDVSLREGIANLLHNTNVQDAEHVYEAIRLAVPGGLGKVPDQDVAGKPTETLLQVMTRSQDYDRIARQYATGFQDIFEVVTPLLEEGIRSTEQVEGGIIFAQLSLLGRFPDSLIVRKCGLEQAREVSRRAVEVLEAGWPQEPAGRIAFQAFDAFLHTQGNQLNPGTTADLLAAGLFVLLREGTLPVPFEVPWNCGFHNE